MTPRRLGTPLQAIQPVVALSLTSIVCFGQSYPWNLPKGFPQPYVPVDNPITPAKVNLGRFLFYDTRLSVNGKASCATCHKQELAFTDGRAVSVGATGEAHSD